MEAPSWERSPHWETGSTGKILSGEETEEQQMAKEVSSALGVPLEKKQNKIYILSKKYIYISDYGELGKTVK